MSDLPDVSDLPDADDMFTLDSLREQLVVMTNNFERSEAARLDAEATVKKLQQKVSWLQDHNATLQEEVYTLKSDMSMRELDDRSTSGGPTGPWAPEYHASKKNVGTCTTYVMKDPLEMTVPEVLEDVETCVAQKATAEKRLSALERRVQELEVMVGGGANNARLLAAIRKKLPTQTTTQGFIAKGTTSSQQNAACNNNNYNNAQLTSKGMDDPRTPTRWQSGKGLRQLTPRDVGPVSQSTPHPDASFDMQHEGTLATERPVKFYATTKQDHIAQDEYINESSSHHVPSAADTRVHPSDQNTTITTTTASMRSNPTSSAHSRSTSAASSTHSAQPAVIPVATGAEQPHVGDMVDGVPTFTYRMPQHTTTPNATPPKPSRDDPPVRKYSSQASPIEAIRLRSGGLMGSSVGGASTPRTPAPAPAPTHHAPPSESSWASNSRAPQPRTYSTPTKSQPTSNNIAIGSPTSSVPVFHAMQIPSDVAFSTPSSRALRSPKTTTSTPTVNTTTAPNGVPRIQIHVPGINGSGGGTGPDSSRRHYSSSASSSTPFVPNSLSAAHGVIPTNNNNTNSYYSSPSPHVSSSSSASPVTRGAVQNHTNHNARVVVDYSNNVPTIRFTPGK
eukprot:PhM_4_TR9332/c0_g1_i1/m.76978